jgi:hypothetical protein
MSGTPEKSVKPTIPSERVPDFTALANEFQSDADYVLYHDLSQRGDKALRRKLFMARPFVRAAREYRGAFKTACKRLKIKGDNIESMSIRFLFGTTLDKHLVNDWSCVVKYWLECEPHEQDVEAASTRKISDLKTAWRKFKQGGASDSPQSGAAAEKATTADESLLREFVTKTVTDVEPALVVEVSDQELDPAVDETDLIYLGRRFRDGRREFYLVELSEKGIREAARLVKSQLPTERAVLVPSDGGHCREAAQ